MQTMTQCLSRAQVARLCCYSKVTTQNIAPQFTFNLSLSSCVSTFPLQMQLWDFPLTLAELHVSVLTSFIKLIKLLQIY